MTALRLVLALAVPVLVSVPVEAQPTKKPPAKNPDLVDISTMKNLIVFVDNGGNYYVAPPKSTTSKDGQVFVGDGKVFYQQKLSGGGSNDSAGTWSYSMWAPRVPGTARAELARRHDGRNVLACGVNVPETELKIAPKKDADRILANAEFRKPMANRVPHLLARDEAGVYYYVDRLPSSLDGSGMNATVEEYRASLRGHRVMVGKKGLLKELPLTNLVSDSGGEIYSTKRGELRFVASQIGTEKATAWIKGRKRVQLIHLPIMDNLYVVYRELGVYGHLGTACEDE
jgi:hypothetical protein